MWFNNLNLPKSTIIQSNRLRTGHTLLSAYTYKLRLNNSLHCILNFNECVCVLLHLFFNCSFLLAKRAILFCSLKSINIPFDLPSILNSNYEYVVNLIINFVLEAGFLI